ncbi:ABC transporter ATP-binding protein [Dielma fastidiosa]|uniref:ABC transporter ATP-binding protein n=1 Tax=Dielma fastidiosa TaxID=1034346 RepID=UPI0023F30D84|nr:ABC transporter ATP-binding protein [Dielma fastidiosa]
MKPLIQFKNIVKEFDGQLVLKGINLDIYENEFVTLLGPSGCGKTTLLRILGGFLEQTEGQVMFDGEEISKLPSYKRENNNLFQKYALFPHMNVYDNVAFGLKIKKEAKDLIEQKVNRMLKLVNLEEYAKRSVTEMSGGQQQRVAIARALVNEPKVLLLDEPLGALDLKLRKEMQHELKKIQQEVGITFIFVTHDQEEALTMSDKIVVMKDGEIQQVGTPEDIYNEPINEYVANFIGESNIVDGVMTKDYEVMFEDKKFTCVDFGFKPNEKVDVVIRPEDLDIVPKSQGKLRGIVKSVLFKGVHYEIIVETKSGTSITVQMHVSDDRPVINESAREKMSANVFYLDVEDVKELTDAEIIARADAQAWSMDDEEESISISKVEYDIKPEKGTYPVTFSTSNGTSVTVNMIVKDQNRVVSKEYGEEIFAENFFKKVDEIQDSVALDTDLKIWANAQAWDLDEDIKVEITTVDYDFDPETIVPGTYYVTFKTSGYEYKVDTTDYAEVDSVVGLKFEPEDIHIMSKSGSY